MLEEVSVAVDDLLDPSLRTESARTARLELPCGWRVEPGWGGTEAGASGEKAGKPSM